MSRNLKALGAAFLAALALGAIVASAAQAKFDTLVNTPEANSIVTAEALSKAEGGTQVTSLPGGTSFACTGFSINETTVKNKVTEITVKPKFTGCAIAGIPTEIETTTCDYLFTGETTVSGTTGKEDATVHIKCTTPGDVIHIKEVLGCKITTPEQTVHGVHYNNVDTSSDPGKHHITIEFTLMNMKIITSGCATVLGTANGEHEGATYTGNITALGYKDVNNAETATKERNGITFETKATAEMP